MSKRKTFFTISILAILLLSFDAKYAYSSTDVLSENTIDYARSQASTFLAQVAGFDMDNYREISFNSSNPPMLNSPTPQTIISAITSDGYENYSLAMTLVHGRAWFYDLTPLISVPARIPTSIDDRLSIARQAISQYQLLFNASYCEGFAQLIPLSATIPNLTVSNANTRLNIETDNSTAKSESTSLTWLKLENGSAIPQMSTSIIVSNTGLVTSFYDNLAVYNVADVEASISREEAILIAEPYIDRYANDNGQTVKTVEATLEYAVDNSASRGDGNTIYRHWKVFAQLAGSNQYSIVQYGVMVWADNGVAYHFGPQGSYHLISTSTSIPVFHQVIIASACVTLAGIILRMRRRIRIKQPKIGTRISLKLAGSLVVVCLLGLSMVQSCSATTSTIFGSRYDVSTEEQSADVTITNAIASYSSGRGYITDNWYGSSTTAANLYRGAYNDGDFFSITFYIGHGNHIADDHRWGWPWQWHTHDHIILTDDVGSLVRDNDIWQNSYYQNINSQKVAILWSCKSSEAAMGSWTTYICGETLEHGMPYAWNHVTSMGFDGYANPDNSGQVFIGFTGFAPYLSYDGFGMNDAGLVFLYHFYYASLVYRWTVNDSLDYASQSVWGVNYGDCTFRNGFPTPDGPGQMVVYGQGTRYM